MQKIKEERKQLPVQDCPQCGAKMIGIDGLKSAICKTCGYKEPCC